MIFGPFTSTAMKSLTLALEKLEVPYEFKKDDELLAELEREWKSKSNQSGGKRGTAYDPAFMILEIEDEAFEAKKDVLVKLGLGGHHDEPEFVEEYVCVDCGKVVAEAPGTCKVHSTVLITWSEHVEKKRNSEKPASPFTKWAWAVVGAGVLGYIAFRMVS